MLYNMDKKPQVFPSKTNTTDTDQTKIAAYEAEKKIVTNEIYTNSANETKMSAVDQMKQRTAEQLAKRDQFGVVREPSLAEKSSTRTNEELTEERTNEQIKLRDEQLNKNKVQTENFQKQTDYAMNRTINAGTNSTGQNVSGVDNITPPPVKPPVYTTQNFGENPSNINPYIQELSQPQYNAAFDVIPLPSEGKLYRNKKPNVKVAYLTTSDENILTSPNLLQSGEFLEILINRKLLEPTLRYRDLTIGDRNAIMLWIRATSYGEMYPVTLLDENNNPFETEINLNELQTTKLGAEPDAEGLFEFVLPITKTNLKFKILTVGDVDDIERLVDQDKVNNIPVNNASTYMLERQIVEFNGSRDRAYIKDIASTLMVRDAKALTEYINNIESGIDLNITVGTPGGGSVKTFLPLNLSFFWPNNRL